ncbi:VOC family protein [Pseudoalteromonas denitrificans]|uniref:VOC domain-containing protein n=1 Tax=Pseudoalteromonas denitrificans DSM 6059 TaxID=1123010 RepID=A0A1I1L3P4_9GAMM|nr:hypothetical protein [Pseudoalteromonas denitrificans]SFC67644.1 hypothetical protein SAMN02745724_02237 [Pseudoalteromonas denitrificans DSM 6059]
MKNKSKILNVTFSVQTLIFLISIISSSSIAQANSCFERKNLEPSFIAINSYKGSNLGKWYQDVFNLKTVKEFAFEGGSATGVLMHNDEFIVEVFFYKNGDVNKQKPQTKSGIKKFGMFTNIDLQKLKTCLNAKGVKATRIYNDKNLNIDLLQVIDPSNNVFEIIKRHAI